MQRFFLYLSEITFFVFLIFFLSFSVSFAQSEFDLENLDVLPAYKIESSSVSGGEIISYDSEKKTYIKADKTNDENLFGVVAENPLMVFNGNDSTEEGVPIISSGTATVKLTTLNGEIKKGDFITSSSWAGKGQKADKDDKYVLGIAVSSLNKETGVATTTPEGEEVFIGEVPVMMGELAATVNNQNSSTTTVKGGEVFGFTVANTLPYLLAAIIVFSSIVIAFKNFMPNIREGLASIGRNPMAKSSIQLMIIFNILLMVAIVGAGFIFGLLIIFLPM